MRIKSLFIPELDGVLAESREQAYEWEQERIQYELESAAENAWLRAAETNDRYAWEVEQDEMRANCWL